MTNIVLLRSPTSSEDGPDPYEAAFASKGHRAVSVATLETAHINLDNLKESVSRGSRTHVRGVIMTSSRAVEAWRIVVRELSHTHEAPVPADDNDWSETPFYVVGESTEAQLREIETSFRSPYSPHIIRGADSGGDERLAKLIINDISEEPSDDLPLLYLVGDKNRDTIPRLLSEAGITLHPLQVYETRGSSTFAHDLSQEMRNLESSLSDVWVAFFAPSSAKFALPFLESYFSFPLADRDRTSDGSASQALPCVKVAAIGPTTCAALRDDLNIHVVVVSPKPGAEPLARCIDDYIHNMIRNTLVHTT